MIKTDALDVLDTMVKASYLQFSTKESFYTASVSALALSHGFDYDEHYRRVISRQKPGGWIDSFNAIGTITTFPFIPGYLYYLSHKRQDEKLYQFTKELTALTYLTLGESAIFSFVDIHERPRTDDLNNFETDFRGDSSFVSGHIIPLTSLTLKTWQYYGPLYGAAPLVFTLIQSYQRVQDEKHWMSDVIGSYVFVAMGDIGVRKANRRKHQKISEGENNDDSAFMILPSSQGIYSQYTLSF